MRVGVVGATGVLARNLIPMLVERGHQVRALARSPEKVLHTARVEAVRHDLLDPAMAAQLPGLLAGCDVVIHAATAIPTDPTAPGAWENNSRLRTEGTRRLLDAALRAGVPQYIQQSIVMAYIDGGDRWLDESTPLDSSPARAGVCAPVIAMEGMVKANDPAQLAWCIVRGGLFVGPGTGQEALIARLRAGQEVVRCDGQNFISPIHVADIAAAFVAVIERNPAGQVFNVVDEPLRQGEYTDRLARLVGAPEPPRDPGQPCPPSYRCTNQAAKTVLRWEPVHGIWPVV